MDIIGTTAVIVSFLVSALCWYRIWKSTDILFFKVAFTVLAAFPVLGPFLYLFADMPPRRPRERASVAPSPVKPSAFLRRWKEREHIYLAWAGSICLVLAVVAYWINGWSPGRIYVSLLGWYTDADIVYQSLLLLAVLIYGAALRAKVALVRYLTSMSASHPQPAQSPVPARRTGGELRR